METTFKDYYLLLEISQSASMEEVRKAYVEQAKKWHPDKNPRVDVTYMMQEINTAYFVLRDPLTRILYDDEYTRIKGTMRQPEQFKSSHARENQGQGRYEYENDELKQRVKKAHDDAASFVSEMLKDFGAVSRKAVAGAWSEIYPYIILTIIFIIGLIVTSGNNI